MFDQLNRAFVAPGSALAQKGKGDSGSSGPIVVPGGTYAEAYVISEPGSYMLGGNRLQTDRTKHIILIWAPDVTLDLGGFTLSYPVPAVTALESRPVKTWRIESADESPQSRIAAWLTLLGGLRARLSR